ncbi:MAG: hypothetical protein RL414_372 [Actinomycetota bacterium]
MHILQSPEFSGVTHVASYISYGQEPQTADINSQLIQRGIKVIVPKLLPDNDLAWMKLTEQGDFEDLEKVGVVIIPALRVDHKGNRLGQGGGSYDRALPRFAAWKIALLHNGEFVNLEIPHEEHDARIDAVATPTAITRF